MRLEEVELHKGPAPFSLGKLTVVTNYPQTNAAWLVNSLTAKHRGLTLALSPTNPLPITSASGDLCVVVGTEMPLLAGLVDASQMMQALAPIRESFNHVLVSVTISDALLDPFYDTGAQLARFATLLLYQAQLVLQLQPLATGRARDITGRLIVAAGPKAEAEVVERSLFFYVNRKTSTVDLRPTA